MQTILRTSLTTSLPSTERKADCDHHENACIERVRDLTVTVWEPDDGLDTILSFDRFFAYSILVRKPISTAICLCRSTHYLSPHFHGTGEPSQECPAIR